MERKTATGRSVLTAPIQAAGSRPAQTAAADFSGMNEFGRALSGVGSVGMNVAGNMQEDKDRLALKQKKNLQDQTLEALDVDLRQSLLNTSLAVENWDNLDHKQRGDYIKPVVDEWEKKARTMAQERGVEIPDSWAQDRVLTYTVPEIRQGQNVFSANMLFERADTELKGYNYDINTTANADQLFSVVSGRREKFSQMDKTYLAPRTLAGILDAGGKNVAERAINFSRSGAITLEQIDRGVKEGLWDNSHANTMRANLTTGAEIRVSDAVKTLTEGKNTLKSGFGSPDELRSSASYRVYVNDLYAKNSGNPEAAKAQHNALDRDIQLAHFIGQNVEFITNDKGLSGTVATWDQVQAISAALSERSERQKFFGAALADRDFGTFTDAEVDAAAGELSKVYSDWTKDIRAGLAYRKFANDVKVQDYMRANPNWLTTPGGWRGYVDVMRDAQRAANIPHQYQTVVPEEVVLVFESAVENPEKLSNALQLAIDPVHGLGTDIAELTKTLAKNKKFADSDAGAALIGGLLQVSQVTLMGEGDENARTVKNLTANLAQTVNWANNGGVENFSKDQEAMRVLNQSARAMDAVLAVDYSNLGKLSGESSIVSSALSSYNTLRAAVANTYSPEIATAFDRGVRLEAMRRSGGVASRVPFAMAEAYKQATAGMAVIVTNGTQRSDGTMNYEVTSTAESLRGWLRQPDGTTIGAEDGRSYGESISLVFDTLATPDQPVLLSSDIAPATTAAIKTSPANLMLGPALVYNAAVIDYFRGKTPVGGIESLWNETKRGFAQNWLGVSIEDSRMEHHSLLAKDPEVMAAIPKVFRPNPATLVVEGPDGKDVHIGSNKPVPRSLIGEAKQVFEDTVRGFTTAKDYDKEALAIAQKLIWKPNSDGNFYAYISPGKMSGGQVTGSVEAGAPQQAFQIIDGKRLPVAVPKAVVDRIAAVQQSRSGSFMGSVVSPAGYGSRAARSIVAASGMLPALSKKTPEDIAVFKAWADQQADVFVRTHAKK